MKDDWYPLKPERTTWKAWLTDIVFWTLIALAVYWMFPPIPM